MHSTPIGKLLGNMRLSPLIEGNKVGAFHNGGKLLNHAQLALGNVLYLTLDMGASFQLRIQKGHALSENIKGEFRPVKWYPCGMNQVMQECLVEPCKEFCSLSAVMRNH